MSQPRNIPAILLPALLACLIFSGCMGGGFKELAPSAGAEFAPVLPEKEKGARLWVRGKIIGDLTPRAERGEGMDDEEVLLVSAQKSQKEDILEMRDIWVCVSTAPGKGRERKLLDRIRLDYVPQSRLAEGMSPAKTDQEMVSGKIRLSDLDGDGGAEIIVSLNAQPGAEKVDCLHYALSFRQGKLVPIFKAGAAQYSCTLQTQDLDRDGMMELIVQEAVFAPTPSVTGPELDKLKLPTWPKIYSRTGAQAYQENNAAFPDYFTPVLLSFFEDLALRDAELPRHEQGLHEKLIGTIYSYKRNATLAKNFFDRASAKRAKYSLPLLDLPNFGAAEKPMGNIRK